MEDTEAVQVLGAPISLVDPPAAARRIVERGLNRQGGFVCCTNVHVVVTALKNGRLSHALDAAWMVVPDGAPIAWALRRKGHKRQQRVPGPQLTLDVCRVAEKAGARVAFYGASPEVLRSFRGLVQRQFPHLNIATAISPPFRSLTDNEHNAHIRELAASDAAVVFVGLGAPKQELWMADVGRRRLNC